MPPASRGVARPLPFTLLSAVLGNPSVTLWLALSDPGTLTVPCGAVFRKLSGNCDGGLLSNWALDPWPLASLLRSE